MHRTINLLLLIVQLLAVAVLALDVFYWRAG